MICKTSEVAACCSNDSLNCCSSHAIFVLWSAVALRRVPVFGVLAALGATVLRLRALASLLLALERRRIAHPKGLGLRRFSTSITAGICARRNGVQGSSCTAAILSRSCPLWVKRGHWGTSASCPL